MKKRRSPPAWLQEKVPEIPTSTISLSAEAGRDRQFVSILFLAGNHFRGLFIQYANQWHNGPHHAIISIMRIASYGQIPILLRYDAQVFLHHWGGVWEDVSGECETSSLPFQVAMSTAICYNVQTSPSPICWNVFLVHIVPIVPIWSSIVPTLFQLPSIAWSHGPRWPGASCGHCGEHALLFCRAWLRCSHAPGEAKNVGGCGSS